jgi:hypothetical protein
MGRDDHAGTSNDIEDGDIDFPPELQSQLENVDLLSKEPKGSATLSRALRGY